MVGTSKILTVSYGTFSCTLEGFDDSFNTMKAIAEYFRGLASEDRYFGAEPPAPDAEMLAKIAEREIARRVDATVEDDGIVLRAAAISDQSGKAPAHDDASRAKVDADRKAAKKARKAEKAAAKAAKKAQAESEADVQAQADAKADADAKSIADAKDAEDARDRAADASEIEAAEDFAETSEQADQPAAQDASDEAPSSSLADTGSAYDETDEANTVPDHPDADSVAAKLQRIRAVVGKGGTTDESPSDDLTEQFLPDTQAPDVADVEAADQDLVADLDAHEAEIEDQHEEDAAEATSTETDDTTDMMSRVMARHADGDTAEAEDAPAETEVEAEDIQQPRARVVRMKRADFEKAIAEKADEKAADVAQEAVDAAPDFALLDGADDLDDYLEDSDFSDDMPVIEDAPDVAVQDDQVVADAPTSQVDDEALDRLMSETDAQMQEPEGSRRRDAIAQLKAAVAAKEAARQVGEPENDGQDVENAFRNDLSDAVGPDAAAKPRPRPVVPAGQRTERPTPAPLKLVAEQRIDMEEAKARRDGPVVPRRVAARTEEPAKQLPAGSFAEFADNAGATELSDLLEAAAAYTAFVEGADEFSRPQILRRVRSVASDDFKREDELRSFAELINAGRFTKVRNGRFQVADDSRFNPERVAS